MGLEISQFANSLILNWSDPWTQPVAIIHQGPSVIKSKNWDQPRIKTLHTPLWLVALQLRKGRF